MAHTTRTIAPSVTRNVIVIDDQKSARLLLAALVTSIDGTASVYSFDDGTSAVGFARLEYALRRGIDVVLCDYELGSQRGDAVIAELRATPSCARARFVIVTAHWDERLDASLRAQGVEAVLRKPVTRQSLQALWSEITPGIARPGN